MDWRQHLSPGALQALRHLHAHDGEARCHPAHCDLASCLALRDRALATVTHDGSRRYAWAKLTAAGRGVAAVVAAQDAERGEAEVISIDAYRSRQ